LLRKIVGVLLIYTLTIITLNASDDRIEGGTKSILEGRVQSKPSVMVQESVVKISGPSEIERFLSTHHFELDPPFPNAKLREIVIKRYLPLSEAPMTIQSIGVRNVSYQGDACGIEVIRKDSAPGPGTLHMSVTNSISNSYSANVSVSASVVSAGVGFNVSIAESITDTYDYPIPAGKLGVVTAHPWKDVYDFEVWEDPWYWSAYKVGDGTAYRVSGICWAAWTN